MDLLLWRHAEAHDIAENGGDLQRSLTTRGQLQAQRVARWLSAHIDPSARILASPALRTQQTVQALTRDYQTLNELAPGCSPKDIIRLTEWPKSAGMTLIVGHQPTLGHLASLLLTGHEAEWGVKKGGLWWFNTRAHDGVRQTVLRAVVSPDLLDDE